MMADMNTTIVEVTEDQAADKKAVETKNVKETNTSEKDNSKDFHCEPCNKVFRTEFSKALHMKRTHNEKAIQYTPIPTNRKVGSPGSFVKVAL